MTRRGTYSLSLKPRVSSLTVRGACSCAVDSLSAAWLIVATAVGVMHGVNQSDRVVPGLN